MRGEGADILPIFRISFYWFPFMGTMLCILTGLIISYMTEENNPPVPKKLLTPVIHSFLSKKRDIDYAVHMAVEKEWREQFVADNQDDEGSLREKLMKT